MSEKILIIRMLDIGDVLNTAVPLVRHLRKRLPDADVHVLTYSRGENLLRLALPDVHCIALKEGEWPDNVFQAMEAFLGLAETVIAEQYQQIINLDTAFMPCFLGRFLKDAGEPIQGNFINMSVQAFIDGIQQQAIQPEYVSNIDTYMDSTWFSMARWHTQWWQGEPGVENGYPEYYLRKCCEYNELEMDFSVDIKPDPELEKSDKPLVGLCLPQQPGAAVNLLRLTDKLNALGIASWAITESMPLPEVFSKLASSQLLVTYPGAEQWYGTAVGCESLVLLGDTDPRILMPNYATDQYAPIPDADSLAESIVSILEMQSE